MMIDYTKLLINELHPLKLFNLFSEKIRIDFLLTIYEKYIESNLDYNVLYNYLNKKELDSYNSQINNKISTIALLVLNLNEFTVFEINKDYEFIEDLLLNADIFLETNHLTEKNKYKLLDFLLKTFSKTDIFDNYIERLILDTIKLKEPIHKNILVTILKSLVDELTKGDIEWAIRKLTSKNLIKLMVTGYYSVDKNLVLAEKYESNYSIILKEIGSYFIDLEKLTNKLLSSKINLPKKTSYLRRLITTLDFKIEENIVLSPQQTNLNLAIETWLKNFSGIIDKSNTEKMFYQNKKLRKIIDEFILLPYENNNKFINVRNFIEPYELKGHWEKVYEIIPDNKILTVKTLSESEEYLKLFENVVDFEIDLFNDLFLASLINADRRIFKINRLSHVFHKTKKISKLDLVYEIVNNNIRISIQMLKLRLEKDFEVNNFSYDLIKKSIDKYNFYKDSQHNLYSSYENYIQFMKRGL